MQLGGSPALSVLQGILLANLGGFDRNEPGSLFTESPIGYGKRSRTGGESSIG